MISLYINDNTKEFFFTTDHCQSVRSNVYLEKEFVACSYYQLSKSEVKEIQEKTGLKEIPNPDPKFASLEAWEKRYLHEKAVRDAYCEAHDIPIPEDEHYGTLKRVDQTSVFNGKIFWQTLEKTGHTSTAYESCKCHFN